jgi:hypothetical protein
MRRRGAVGSGLELAGEFFEDALPVPVAARSIFRFVALIAG